MPNQPSNPNPEPPPPSMARILGRTHGGRRPGAGAPRGNTNALKPCPERGRSRRDGRYSVRHRRIIQAFAETPAIRDDLATLGARLQRRHRHAEAGAADVLARLFQQIGEQLVLSIGESRSRRVLCHSADQVEPNQAFLAFLRRTEAELTRFSEWQSKDADAK